MKILLYMLIVISFLDMFTQLPILSPYAVSLGAEPLMIGLIVGMYSLTNLFGNVMAGKWIDRYGAQGVIISGMVSTAVVLGMYWFVQTPVQLVMARFIHGFTAGLLVPSAFTLVAKAAEQGKQGRNMAVSGAAVGIAVVIGPALGGILKAKIGVHSVFLFMAVLMIVGALMAWFWLPRNRKKEDLELHSELEPVLESEQVATTERGLLPLFQNSYAVQSYLGAFALMFNMGVLSYMLPLKTEGLGLGEHAAGLMLSTFGIIAIFIFLLPTNRVFDRISSRTMMLAGMAIISAAVLSLSFFAHEKVLYLVMAIFGTGFALLFPSLNTIIAEHVPEVDRGKAFGLFYAFFSVGVVIGSFTVGAMALSPDGGFRLAAVFMMVMTLVIVGWGRFQRTSQP